MARTTPKLRLAPPGIDPDTDRLIRLREVCRRVGISGSLVWRLISKGRFPKPIHIGRSALWLEAEVQNWIAEAVQRDRKGVA